jgi:quinol-cytochrome oxidoreductase complex cytochrome b subunit
LRKKGANLNHFFDTYIEENKETKSEKKHMTKSFAIVIIVFMMIYTIVENIMNIPTWLNNGIYIICTIFAIYFLIKMKVGAKIKDMLKE